MKNLNLWIAIRFLFAKKEVGFISWSGVISILGLAIGCFSLIIAISVLNGFEEEIQEKVINYEGDVRIHGISISDKQRVKVESLLLNSNEVNGFSSYIERKAIAIANKKRSLIRVKAVEQMGEEVYRIDSIDKLDTVTNIQQVKMGIGLAERLDLLIGDTLSLISPLDSQLLMGFPSSGKFIVSVIFKTNILDFDEKTCFIPLKVGQELFRMKEKVDGIDVRLSEDSDPGILLKKLSKKIPNELMLSTWADLHQTLFAAMRMEKIGSTVVLSLIILVAAFNLTSTLVMLVMEKIREIGILKTLGATHLRIRRIFGVLGSIIGGMGLLIGVVSGLFFILIQQHWNLIQLPEHIYFIKSLPMVLPVLDVVVILVIGFVLVAVSIFYPAVIASRLLPKESVHFEK